MPGTKKERPRHLGRGLQSLIGPLAETPRQPETTRQLSPDAAGLPPDTDLQQALQEIDIERIDPNPHQARTTWDEAELSELAASIRANGVIQPILVRPDGSRFQLIAGERRFRASQLAGLQSIPAWVRQATDEQLHEWALVENIHRSDLNALERAKAYRLYIDTFSLTQADAAQRLGEERSVVANYLRLLDLPAEIKQMLSNGDLTMGHARAILALPTDDLRRRLANKALAGRLSVREVERLVRRHLTGSSESKRTKRDKEAHILDLERRLGSQLGTKVSIETRKGGQRGRMVIDFYSLDEFEGIAERLGVSLHDDA